LASSYVELFRNTRSSSRSASGNLLVTPAAAAAAGLDPGRHRFLSNRGLVLTVPKPDPAWSWVVLAPWPAAIAAWLLARLASLRRRQTGYRLPVALIALGLIAGLPVLAWLAAGAPTQMDVPVMQGFNFRGGVTLQPEFIALFLGLSLYIAAFIAEIVRSGIQSVGRADRGGAAPIGSGPATSSGG